LRLGQSLPIAKLRSIPFEWKASVDNGGAQPIEFSQRWEFVVSNRLQLLPRKTPVVVDGNLKEWDKLSQTVRPQQITAANSWTGPEDARYAFQLSYDERAVYIAVNVIDDKLVAVKESRPWQQDAIEISLDPRDDPQRSGNRRNYSETWHTYAYFAFSPAASPGQMSFWERDRIPQGVQVVCVPTATGYAAEIAIPHEALNALRSSGAWSALRFNIAIHDADEASGPSATLWWQPDWHSAENIAGSGTFFRPPPVIPAVKQASSRRGTLQKQ
jgi:hypothetical protein